MTGRNLRAATILRIQSYPKATTIHSAVKILRFVAGQKTAKILKIVTGFRTKMSQKIDSVVLRIEMSLYFMAVLTSVMY